MRGTQFAQLSAFVAVAKRRSFTRAASHLGISPGGLSNTIRSLEESFAVRLLNRTTRSVSLTDAGEQLLRDLLPAIDGVERAVDAMNSFRDKPAGAVRLAVHPIAAEVVVAPLMARFASEYPTIRLEISVDDAQKDIVGNRFDAGIQFGDRIAQDMIAVAISGETRLITVAAPSYLASRGRPTRPDDLRSHNCIRHRWSADGAPHGWKFDKNGQVVDVPVDGVLIVNDLDLALRASLDGGGIAQLPESWVSASIASGDLVPVLEDWSAGWPGFVLYYPGHRQFPLALRKVIDFLRAGSKRASRFVSEPPARAAARRIRPEQGRPDAADITISSDGAHAVTAFRRHPVQPMLRSAS